MRPKRNIKNMYEQTKQFSDMKKFNYKVALECHAEEAVAALYWCRQEQVLVDKSNNEVDWLNRNGIDCDWKNLWKVLEYYPYTTVANIDYEKETSEFNFRIGDFNTDTTRGLADLLRDVWFGYVERKYKKADNKTALKLQNRLTGKIVYMGWYDGVFTVTERPAHIMDSWITALEINED